MTNVSPHDIQRYGWIPDLPDARDHTYSAPLPLLGPLPASVDLRPGCPSVVYNQAPLNACTGEAIAGAIHFERLKQSLEPDFIPSALFIYYNERVTENTVAVDSGAQIRDGIKSVAALGVCSDTVWPYDFNALTHQPSQAAYAAALTTRAVSYSRVARSLGQFKGCLASGYPFVFGFTVYDGFESDEVGATGTVPMPGPQEVVIGGHAVLAVGYDDLTQRFLIRNSWGAAWGDGGYFTMPYAYLLESDLADDFWTIRLVGG